MISRENKSQRENNNSLNAITRGMAEHYKSISSGLFALTLMAPQVSQAGPVGGDVTGGEGTIDYNGTTTTIDQLTDKLSINWDSFNLSADELVRFLQPNASSLVLNRILDDNASVIHGQIDANGHVLLVNPRGLLFTETAQINVNSLTASSLDIATDDFMNDDFAFKALDGTDGIVVNRGTVNAASGIVLQGEAVENSGTLVAADYIALAGGSESVLTFDADQLIGVRVTREVLENQLGIDSAVLNSGTIRSGEVLLTASVASALFNNAVNNQGVIEATGIDTQGGTIRLGGSGGDVADVVNSGTLDVSGRNGHGIAGQVQLDGETIVLQGGTKILATADEGTGSQQDDILVNADIQIDPGGNNKTRTLTLEADGDIAVNGYLGIAKESDGSDKAGDIDLIVDAGNTLHVGEAGAIDTGGGDFTAATQHFINNGSIDLSGGTNDYGHHNLEAGRNGPGTDSIIQMGELSGIYTGSGATSRFNLTLSSDNNTLIFSDGTYNLSDNSFVTSADLDRLGLTVDDNLNALVVGKASYSKQIDGSSDITLETTGGELQGTSGDDSFTVFNDGNSHYLEANSGTTKFYMASVDGQGGADSLTEDASSTFDQAVITGSAEFSLHQSGAAGDSDDVQFSSVETVTTGKAVVNESVDDMTAQVSGGHLTAEGVTFQNVEGYTGSGNDNITDSDDNDWATGDTDNTAVSGGITFAGIDRVTSGGSLSSASQADQTVDYLGSREMSLKGIRFSGADTFEGDAAGNRVDTVNDQTSDSTWAIHSTGEVRKDGQIFKNIDVVKTSLGINNAIGADQDVTLDTTVNGQSTANTLELADVTFVGDGNYTGSGSDNIDDQSNRDWGIVGDKAAQQHLEQNDTRLFTGIDSVTSTGQVSNDTGSDLSVVINRSFDNTLTAHNLTFTGLTGYIGDQTLNDTVTGSLGSSWYLTGYQRLNDQPADNGFLLDNINHIGGGVTSLEHASGFADEVDVTVRADSKLSIEGILFDSLNTYAGNNTDNVLDERGQDWAVTGIYEATSGSFSFSGIDHITTTGNASGQTSDSSWLIKGDQSASSDGITFAFGDTDTVISNVGRVSNDSPGSLAITLDQIDDNGSTKDTLDTGSVTFVDSTGYTGSGSDSVTDNIDREWYLTDDQTINTREDQTGFQLSGIARAIRILDIRNKSLNNLNLRLLADSSLVASGIGFAGAQSYTGSGSDTITDELGQDWSISGTQQVGNGSLSLTGITRVVTAANARGQTSDSDWLIEGDRSASSDGVTFAFTDADTVISNVGSIHNETQGSLEVELKADSSLQTASINFMEASGFLGTGQDSVTDQRGLDWRITGVNEAVTGNTDDSDLTFAGINAVETGANVTGRSTDSAWSFYDNVSASSDGITFDFTDTDTIISNAGMVTNATSSGKAVTVNQDQSLSVHSIQFADASGYTGHSDQTDTVDDTTNKGWNLDGSHAASQQVSGVKTRSFTNIAGVTTTGNITETATNNWESQGNTIVKAGDITFTGTSQVTTAGRLSSAEATDQSLTVNDSDLSLNGVAFVGATGFDGDASGSRVDSVDDNRSSPTDWAITGANDAESGSLSFNDIDAVATEGNVAGRTADSDWSIVGTRQAKSDGIQFTLEGTDADISNVGTVTNDSATTLNVALNNDSSITAAELRFIDASGYTGLADNSDSVTDDRGLGWSITGDYALRSDSLLFANIGAVSQAGVVVDDQNSDWRVGLDNTITTATDGKILFTGATRVTTTGSLTNDTGSDQNITLSDNAGVAVTGFDDLGITFNHSASYTGGYTGNGSDNVNDTTSKDWLITDSGAAQVTDSASASRNFTGIDRVTTTGGLTNNTGDALAITLDQVDDNGTTKEIIATDSITFVGSSDYTGSGSDTVTDTIGRDWYITGDNRMNTAEDSSGMDLSGIAKAMNILAVRNQALLNLDVSLLADSSLTAAGINFTDIQTYAGSGTDNIIDNPGQDWSVTGIHQADTSTLSFTGIDHVTTAANARGQNSDSDWLVEGDRSASSDGVTFAFTDADTVISNVGSIRNETQGSLKVELKADSSLQTASINFMEASGFVGTGQDSVTDLRGLDWRITGVNDAVTGNTDDSDLIFTGISAVETGANVTGRSADSEWRIAGNQSAASDDITFTFTDTDTTLTHAGSVSNGSGSNLTWNLLSADQQVSAADMKFQGVSTITGYDDGQGNGDTINATTDDDVFEVTGDGSLTTKGIAFNSIRMILAGDGKDTVVSNVASEWQLGGELNRLLVEGMTFADVETAQDQSGNGSLRGSQSDDTINWLGNGLMDAAGMSFSGLTAIDGGDGNDLVSIQGEVDSLTSLTGGDGNGDTLENRQASFGWKLLSAGTSLGGQAFSGFENLTHTENSLNLESDSAVSLGSQTIATGSGSVAIGDVSRFDNLVVATDQNISGQARTDRLTLQGNNISLATTGDMTIDSVVATGNVEIDAFSGTLVIDSIVAEDSDVTLQARAGDILALDKDGVGYHIVADNVSMNAIGYTISSEDSPFHILSKIASNVNFIASRFYSPRIYVNDQLSDSASFTYLGERLLNVYELGDMAAAKSESQDVVNQLGNIDPAVFTAINSFSISENSLEEPLSGDYLLVESGFDGMGLIEALPSEATATGDSEEGEESVESF
ncbi:filamentous hemagglutinin N-terminal domain-containing protein [Endozoicomonas lisbonensis]|uniref:Filamentous hemagglutinin family protein n=1 Tax=Endozoicomonas lisbonensis TaxID=3120522 RepID=A0ABV2SAR6_9GAMM